MPAVSRHLERRLAAVPHAPAAGDDIAGGVLPSDRVHAEVTQAGVGLELLAELYTGLSEELRNCVPNDIDDECVDLTQVLAQGRDLMLQPGDLQLMLSVLKQTDLPSASAPRRAAWPPDPDCGHQVGTGRHRRHGPPQHCLRRIRTRSCWSSFRRSATSRCHAVDITPSVKASAAIPGHDVPAAPARPRPSDGAVRRPAAATAARCAVMRAAARSLRWLWSGTSSAATFARRRGSRGWPRGWPRNSGRGWSP